MNTGRGGMEGWCAGENAADGCSRGSTVLELESRSLGDEGKDEDGEEEERVDGDVFVNAEEAKEAVVADGLERGAVGDK